MNRTTLSGRVWKFGDGINTDVMLPGHAMFLPDDQRAHCLFQAYRPGWVDQLVPSDFIVAGKSFGMGSSRPVSLVLKNAGIACVIAESVGRLFFRNSVNFGLLTIECPGVSLAFKEGHVAEIDFPNTTVRNRDTGETLKFRPLPEQLFAIMTGGGIFPLLEAQGLIAPLTNDSI